MVPQQWRDLQQALEKERASSLKLQTELNRIRQEMQAAKMEGIRLLLSKVCLKSAREEVKFSVAKLARHTLASFEGEHAYRPRLTVKILLLLSLNLLGSSEQSVPRK